MSLGLVLDGLRLSYQLVDEGAETCGLWKYSTSSFWKRGAAGRDTLIMERLWRSVKYEWVPPSINPSVAGAMFAPRPLCAKSCLVLLQYPRDLSCAETASLPCRPRFLGQRFTQKHQPKMVRWCPYCKGSNQSMLPCRDAQTGRYVPDLTYGARYFERRLAFKQERPLSSQQKMISNHLKAE